MGLTILPLPDNDPIDTMDLSGMSNSRLRATVREYARANVQLAQYAEQINQRLDFITAILTEELTRLTSTGFLLPREKRLELVLQGILTPETPTTPEP